MARTSHKSKAYDTITTYEGLEGLRHRPSMYIGSTVSDDDKKSPRGLIQIAQEVISNSTDEALNGYGDTISVTLNRDGSLTVQDEGRGIPAGKDFDDVIRAATVLHSSGKFDSESYNTSGGQNGIGLKGCVGLSTWARIDVVSDVSGKYTITFNQDKVVEKKKLKRQKNEKTGTTVTFMPDPDIFSTTYWEMPKIARKLDSLAYVTPSVTYTITDNRGEEQVTKTYHHPNGMQDMVSAQADGIDLVGMDKPLRIMGGYSFDKDNKPLGFSDQVGQTKDTTTIGVEVALAWTESINEEIICYTNGIPNKDGGPHLDGARAGISRVVTEYAKNQKLLKGKEKITAEDTRDGIIMVVSVNIPGSILQFESQTKEKLGTTQARVAVQKVLEDQLGKWLYDNNTKGKAIISRMKDASGAREAALKARKMSKISRSAKSKKDIFEVSTKLAKSTARNPKDRELVLVEGDSAGGSVIKGREMRKINGKNSIIQAVLPLRGKIKNIGKVTDMNKVLNNVEVSTIVQTLGAGILKDYDEEKLQYDKVVILADGDDDGAHIVSLIITLFWELMPDFIKKGHLYVAQPPLFRFDTYKNGKRIKEFALDNEEYDKVKDKYKGWSVTRLKGLGEMDATELNETVIKQGNRKLIRVTSESVKESNAKINLLMGDSQKGAEKRRQWIRSVVDFLNDEGDDTQSLSEISQEIDSADEDLTANDFTGDDGHTAAELHREAQEDFNYIELSDVLSASMSRYAKAAILRAIPDVRDGLKPVHRRIIHTMNTNNWSPKSKHTKMAKVVGAVLAYHPHGDSSVFDAAVPMSQPWSFNVPYLDIDGNNGSPLNTKDWAASRYIEGRLDNNVHLLVDGIKEHAVKIIPNYDNTETEPVVMNAQYPALLTNGSKGMAVGFSTLIEPHNPLELLKAAELVNRKPDATLSDIMRFVKGPDLPTGGVICGRDEIKEIYKTGQGKFVIRGKVETNKNVIRITELPYTVTRGDLMESIAKALSTSVVGNQVKAFDDETLGDESYCNICITLDRKADVENFVQFLYKKTKLQVNFAANHYAIIGKEPRLFSLQEYLHQFIDFRKECTRNQYEYEQEKKQKRLHIVEGFIKLISTDVTDKVINEIKKTQGTKQDAAHAIEKFGFSFDQAMAIVAVQLYRLNAHDLDAFQKEETELHNRLDFLHTVLTNEEEFTKEISRLLKETQKHFKDYKRKTILEDEAEEIDVQEEDFIESADVTVVVKPDGLQRMSRKVYENNVEKYNGTVVDAIDTTTVRGVGLFTRKGRFMQRTVHELEHESIVNDVVDLHKTVSTFTYDDDIIYSVDFPMDKDTGLEVVSVTARGQVKRCPLDKCFFKFTQKGYLTRSNPYNGLKVSGDEVVYVETMPTEEVEKTTLRITKNGKGRATLVPLKDISIQGASGSGTRKVNTKAGDTLTVEKK